MAKKPTTKEWDLRATKELYKQYLQEKSSKL